MKKSILSIIITMTILSSFGQSPTNPSNQIINEFKYYLKYAWEDQNYAPLKSRVYNRGRMYGYSIIDVDIMIEKFMPINEVWKILCEPIYWGGYGDEELIYGALKEMGMTASSASTMAKFIYNYAVAEKEETERIQKEEEEEKRREEKKLLIKKIKTHIFPYDSIAPESYNEATYLINKKLNTICQDHSSQSLNIDFEVEFLIDSLGITTFRKIKGLEDDIEANRAIENFLGSFTLPPGEINGIKCNAKFLLKYQYTSVYNEYDFALTYNSKGIKTEVITREENFIKEHLAQNDLPYGKYNLKMKSKTVNGSESKSITINSYKSFSGAGAFIPSLFIPGIGNRMVTGKGKSGIGITITCYAIVGSGVLTKLASNKQYDLYHKATSQSEIDKYYDKANLSHQVSIGLIGAGSAIWIYNVYRVYRLGKRNRENQRSMEEKITPSLSYTPRNGFQAGLSFKF